MFAAASFRLAPQRRVYVVFVAATACHACAWRVSSKHVER